MKKQSEDNAQLMKNIEVYIIFIQNNYKEEITTLKSQNQKLSDKNKEMNEISNQNLKYMETISV